MFPSIATGGGGLSGGSSHSGDIDGGPLQIDARTFTGGSSTSPTVLIVAAVAALAVVGFVLLRKK